MTSYDNIKKTLLHKLKDIKEDINYKLCKLYDISLDINYQKDILDLANNDISLLPAYYNNSSPNDKRKFSDLVNYIYKDKIEKENFISEFMKLNILNKKRFINELDYGHVNYKITNFINKIKDNIINNSKNIEKIEQLKKRIYITNKLIDYLNNEPGLKEIEDIEYFISLLENINLNINYINKFLYIVIINNNLFYKNNRSKYE